jgi:two-component system, chemotaxis family, response regulator Rcp1
LTERAENKITNESNQTMNKESSLLIASAESKGQALEIMLVEDSLIDARVTIESLKNCGYYHRLTLFREAHEAIDFLNKRGVFSRAPKPHIILLDLVLPDSDGVTFLRMLRSNRELMNIPVVVLTSSEDSKDQQECEKLGISSYIVKPFNEDKFLNVIRRLKSLALALEAAQCEDEKKLMV